ncbi:hypothetical protein C6349_08305 [Bacillus subtilis subsp. subtilis]|nr:hypothetical protein BSn5_03425 [Bacillus subtilis BSn5]ASC81578.1 hypothetical protein CDA59_03385 [Bacillus subtilis]KAA0937680.1 hypothetical protein FQ086_09030 [Bacillus sp. ANT_WA51]PRS93515.1 hypothetical protein C6350_13420 [Bacillus subtilis subsp. subtilis]NEX07500.1 hypothetical protein [Bacillus subtilis]
MQDLTDNLFPVRIQVIFFFFGLCVFQIGKKGILKNHQLRRNESRMIFTEGDTLTIGKNSDSKKLFIERRETEV